MTTKQLCVSGAFLIIGALFFAYSFSQISFGLPVMTVAQGGTGSSTLSGILKGNGTSGIGTVVIGSNLTWDGTTLSGAAAGAGVWPFTSGTWEGVVAAATSTNYRNTGTIAASSSFSTLASSTVFTNTGNTYFPALTSALITASASGLLEEYAGTTCTNQFATALSALGAATCASVVAAHLGDADWGDITIASNVASVEDDSHAHTGATLSGIDISADTNLAVTYPVLLTDDTLSIAFGTTTANTWSALQTITNASTTNLTTSQSFFINGVRQPQYMKLSSGHSTSTWSGTTTARILARDTGTLKDISCDMSAGTVNVQVYVNSTAVTPMFNASTTAGIVTFSANNTFTDRDTIKFDFGTPASTPKDVDCTVRAHPTQ